MARKVTIINQYLPILKTKVAVYCRVSTADEDQAQSLDNQITYYKDMISHHFDWELVNIYFDVKSGKSTTGRAEFKKMLADCFSNKIDLIITKSISRFGRNTVDVMDAINKLAAHSVDVFFEAENIHTREVGYSFLIPLLEAAAQAESEARSENIKWGIRRSLEKTDSKLYRRSCLGYRQSKSGDLVIDETEAEIVRKVFALYLKGYSIIAIIRELEDQGIKSPTGKNRWSKRTIDTILSNEKYMGNVHVLKTYGDEYPNSKRHTNRGQTTQYKLMNGHPAIISEEQFNMVQAEKARRSNIQIDENGTLRKSTHYSMKSPENSIK